MRMLINGLTLLMIAGLLAGVAWYHQKEWSVRNHLDYVSGEVALLRQQILFRAAMGKVELSPQGFPVTVDPDWFTSGLPGNPLLESTHPWIEICDSNDWEQYHPVDPVAVSRKSAQFWYNPANGIVRARIPVGISDAASLKMYNHINDCDLKKLFELESVPH